MCWKKKLFLKSQMLWGNEQSRVLGLNFKCQLKMLGTLFNIILLSYIYSIQLLHSEEHIQILSCIKHIVSIAFLAQNQFLWSCKNFGNAKLSWNESETFSRNLFDHYKMEYYGISFSSLIIWRNINNLLLVDGVKETNRMLLERLSWCTSSLLSIETVIGTKMAEGGGSTSVPNTALFPPPNDPNPFKTLYPFVNEEETPIPRSWSAKDKFNFIGLSQNNLRVHYKGECWSTSWIPYFFVTVY